MSSIPYKSEKQRRFMESQKPEIAARWRKSGHAHVQKDAETKVVHVVEHAPKGKKGFIKPLLIGVGGSVVGGAVANQIPRVVMNPKKKKVRVERTPEDPRAKFTIEKMLSSHRNDPFFNQAAAQKAFDLVMKMDDDSAEMFCMIVASDLYEDEIAKNLNTLQRDYANAIDHRMEMLKKAVVRKAAQGDERAVEYAEAISRISKAPHTPQYYGYDWEESDFRRDPGTGRFAVKVKHTMEHPMKKEHAELAIGSYGPDDMDHKMRAQYQDEYRQVASFLDMASQITPGGTGNVDVVYHLKDKAGNNFSTVKNGGLESLKPMLADPDTKLVAMEAKPHLLSAGGAAYGLSGANMNPDQMRRANVLASEQGFQRFVQNYTETNDPEASNSRMYGRLQATGSLANQVGAPGSKVQLAGKLAEVVGQYGPEAEKVIGPPARKTAYRYRGTEKAPDEKLVRVYGAEIADAKRFGSPQAEQKAEQERWEGFGTQREKTRGDFTSMGARKPTGARERRAQWVTPSINQMAQEHYEAERRAQLPPSWDERSGGTAVATEYLRRKLPSRALYSLHLEAGNTPPSEGVIINSEGQLAVQAVGYGDDHYLPFNLKNLKSLKGGEYIRNRSVGGLTSEDIYTGLVSGARRVTVVSRSGTFSMEFEPDFRGGRRHNDKAKRMTRRYEHLLDAVQSGQVERAQVPPRWRKAIEQEVRTEYANQPQSYQREMINDRLKEFKEKPEIEGRDLDRAETMIADVERRAVLGEFSEQEAKEFRSGVMRELQNMKEVRFRLNGLGYEAALKSLEEQFPYYIKRVDTDPKPDEEKSFEEDKGYVEPGRNRPTKARAGFKGTETNPGHKFSASLADYQGAGKGKGKGKVAFRAIGEARVEETPADRSSSSSDSKATLDPKKLEQRKLADKIAERTKGTQLRTAATEMFLYAKGKNPEFTGGTVAPDFWAKDKGQFEEWFDKPGNSERFHSFMQQQAEGTGDPAGPAPWNEVRSGMDKFQGLWSRYDAARGSAKAEPFSVDRARQWPTYPFSFPDDDDAAFHANAKPEQIDAALIKIDREDVAFAERKPLSEMTEKELQADQDMFNTIQEMLTDSDWDTVLPAMRTQFPEMNNLPKMKDIATDTEKSAKHFENIHKVRFLKKKKDGGTGGGTTGFTSGGQAGGTPPTGQNPPATPQAGGPAPTGQKPPSSGAGQKGGLPGKLQQVEPPKQTEQERIRQNAETDAKRNEELEVATAARKILEAEHEAIAAKDPVDRAVGRGKRVRASLDELVGYEGRLAKERRQVRENPALLDEWKRVLKPGATSVLEAARAQVQADRASQIGTYS